MTFREAFLIACNENRKATKGNAKAIAKARDANPRVPVFKRLWKRMEAKVRKKYERETGQKVADWEQILDWLVANLPAILQLLITILPLFL